MAMNADPATTQIFGIGDIGVHAHHEAAMVKSAMRKHGDRSDRGSIAFQTQVLCDLKLADIKFQILDEPFVPFPRWQRNYR
jgi:hypothetical protein